MRRTFCLLIASAVVLGLTVLSGAAVAASPQTSPESCGTCHEREYVEWARSAHAHASKSEVFTRLLASAPEAGASWGADACLGCHDPLASGGSLSDGVSCQVCHFMESVGVAGSGDFRLDRDGVVRGPSGKQAPHPAVASTLLTDSLLCGACHEQYHPITSALLQSTYSEWLASPAASKGIGCQDCHMRSGGAVSHAVASSLRASEERLSALGQAISMSLRVPEALRAGEFGVVEVRLENIGAGHSLPTGKSEGHEMWLEVTVETADGRILHHERLSYGVVYENSEGEHDVPVSLWDAAGVFADHRLAPNRAVLERFPFAVPMDVQGEAQAVATLVYHSLPSWLSETLGLPDVEATPVHTASAAIRILAPRPSPTHIPPTPAPTSAPVPTSAGGGGVTETRAEGREWVVPFLALGGSALFLVGVWAFRRRAV